MAMSTLAIAELNAIMAVGATFDRAHLGACYDRPDLAPLFFPENGDRATEAKKICSGCPVAAECLAFAQDTGQAYGVWGGASPRDRAAIRTGRHGRRGGHTGDQG